MILRASGSNSHLLVKIPIQVSMMILLSNLKRKLGIQFWEQRNKQSFIQKKSSVTKLFLVHLPIIEIQKLKNWKLDLESQEIEDLMVSNPFLKRFQLLTFRRSKLRLSKSQLTTNKCFKQSSLVF